MNYFQKQLKDKHLKIVNFFIENEFGTSMPILTYLSTLAPIDRCIILEKLFEITPGNIDLYDKMLLAYVKVGRVDLAKQVLKIAKDRGESDFNIWGMSEKLDLGIPPERSNQQRMAMFKEYLSEAADRQEIEFLNLLINFIK